MEHDKANLDLANPNDHHVLTSEGVETGTGRRPGKQLTVASEQNADVVPDLQVRACLAVLAAGWYWIVQLFTITALAAYSRNITAASALGGSDKQSWVLNAYNVVTIVAAPTFSYFADQYGRRWLLIVPALAGCIGGAIACRASSVEMVIVGTAFIGLAGSRLGISTAVPSEVMPHRYRSIAQSVVFTMSALGAFPALLAISKSIGSDAVAGWRLAFYIIIAGYAMDGLLWLVVYKPPPRRTEITENRPSLDYVGYALLGVASVLFLIGLTWGGVTYPWSSSHVLGTLIPGIALYFAFGIWEWMGRSDGICHHALFKSRNFPLAVVAVAIEGFVYLSFTALFPGQLATVYEHDIFKAGALACIFYAAFLVILPIGGLYAAKTRDIITPIIAGYIVFSAGIVGFLCSKPDNMGVFLAMDALAGIGFSQPLVFLTVVAQFAAPPSLIALSTAIVLSVRALGGAVGIAITQTVLESNISSKLPAYIASATIPLGLNPQQLGPVIGAATGDTSLIEAILAGRIPGVTPQILGAASAAAAQAFSDSYRLAWAVVLPFSVVGGLSLVLFKRNREQLDYIIDAPMEHVHHHHTDVKA